MDADEPSQPLERPVIGLVRHQQHSVLQRQLPRLSPAGSVGALASQLRHQLPKAAGLSPVNGAIQDGTDVVITPLT